MLILREPQRNLEATRGPAGWHDLRTNPPRFWSDSPAALRLAELWEASSPEIPAEIQRAFWATPFETFEPSLAIPAYEVSMPGGWIGTLNDLFLTGGIGDELAVVTVNAAGSGDLGPTVEEWLHVPSPGRVRRLAFLKEELNLPAPLPESTRCQLIHRAASPLLEARRLGAAHAAMVVVAFGAAEQCHEEYSAFMRLLTTRGERGRLERIPSLSEPDLWIGWVEA